MFRRPRGVWRVIHLRKGRWLTQVGRSVMKGWAGGVGLFAFGLYVYIVIVHPIASDIIPSVTPVGSPLPRLTSLWIDNAALPTAALIDVSQLESCDVSPVTTQARVPVERMYGIVPESELPWTASPPYDLVSAKQQTGATGFVTAFRTTLPQPTWDEEHNVITAAGYLAGTVILPDETFSVIGTAGPFTSDRGYKDGPTYIGGQIVPTIAGGVCKIGTTVYNAAVHADLRIVERKPHSMPVNYASAGRDAAISTGSKDVKFLNDKGSPVLLWAEVKDRTLYVAIYGRYEPPVVTWHHEELSRQKTWVIRNPVDDLSPGEQRIAIAGIDGVTVRTTVQVAYRDLEPVTKLVYVDQYAPLPETIEYGR